MNTYQSELVVDLHVFGYRNEELPFRVRLTSTPLTALIADAEQAARIYELLLISRPGDLWDYVVVVPEVAPKRIADRLGRVRPQAQQSGSEAMVLPFAPVPLSVFDKFFYASGDDTDPEDGAWLRFRRSAMLSAYLGQLLTITKSAQHGIQWNDHLIRHITARIQQGKHPHDDLPRAEAIERSRETKRNAPSHTPAFYKKLRDLIQDGNVASIAYRASGDYQVLRMLATEQRRRMNITGHAHDHALYISALVNHSLSNSAWDAEINYYSEGLGYGDLFIEGGGLGATTVKELIEMPYRPPRRYAFCALDQGEIKGYTREAGDGWWLYSRDEMLPRRRCMDKVFHDRHPYVPIMALEASGSTLFVHEHTIIVVGLEVSVADRSALAAIIHEWQGLGGSPMLVVQGDASPFITHGCHDVLTPQHGASDLDCVEWLHALIWDRRPWTDAVMLFQAPHWARAELVEGLRNAGNPWAAWYVVAGPTTPLENYQAIEGSLAEALTLAHRRAQQMRLRLC